MCWLISPWTTFTGLEALERISAISRSRVCGHPSSPPGAPSAWTQEARGISARRRIREFYALRLGHYCSSSAPTPPRPALQQLSGPAEPSPVAAMNQRQAAARLRVVLGHLGQTSARTGVSFGLRELGLQEGWPPGSPGSAPASP